MTRHDMLIQQQQRLIGFLEGIAIDYELTDSEIVQLASELRDIEQAVSQTAGSRLSDELDALRTITASFVDSGRLKEAEKERILEAIHGCLEVQNQQNSYGSAVFISRLLGILQGLLSDNVVTAQERVDLEDLLEDYAEHSQIWPFNEIRLVLDSLTSSKAPAETSHAQLLVIVSELKATLEALNSSK